MGVPLLLVVEPNDVQNQTISVKTRIQNTWQAISADSIEQVILKYFSEVEKQIREDAETFLEEKIKIAKSRDELVNLVDQNYLVKFAYCGLAECGINLERDSVGEILGIGVKEKEHGKCIGCGNESTVAGYFSRRAQSP
ncbi:MAG: hypothetical protein COV55_05195 [Candidatus Komeilibacteria bacterium CG11_big_fil_rev_8_21_14_0_20_36_20]|uniref:Proline-tRNA ligase class II C-terminal domain-containing protein n=1 Tax=Candidatus Komeilibacteria bacterium CG11_big_fil_rev_8_21_14_0_20_36_20 TaxID=1974477 RepID=A0A2H0NB05_9BACT|nr:MAG: hypothetical protein COV55_05195 [Candidatus Komeilibacteria bacterium CG11_big_fil_rev_8_21_14_0_20_36_20]PIR82091.1 MAG: hypothetical protein COU21_00440 [Candidatus Komeilibacteria bacterium CG10_big_fil_rev_8_21_14_0_10_36_65]